jgi:serine/threonine-protein kinase HipA
MQQHCGEHNRMALKLNGRDDKLRRADFRTFASTAGLTAAVTDATIDDLLHMMAQALNRIALPTLGDYGPNGRQMADQMLAIVRTRVSAFT